MAKTSRVPTFVRLANVATTTLLRAGVPLGPNSLLMVRGRKSGRLRTFPVAVLEIGGERYLMAAYGVGDWVRNLRSAGSGTLTRRRHTEAFTAVELPATEAAPILKEGLSIGPNVLRRYFDADPSSSLAAFEREAQRHPVFHLRPAAAKNDGAVVPISRRRESDAA